MTKRVEQAFTTDAASVRIANQVIPNLDGQEISGVAIGKKLRIQTDADVFIKFNKDLSDTITGAADADAEFFPEGIVEIRAMSAQNNQYAHGITGSGTANVEFSWVG